MTNTKILHIRITDEQHTKLKKLVKRLRIGWSDLIRLAIEGFINKFKE